MATQSPFSLVADAVEKLGSIVQPPEWMAEEVQHRLVLFLNHVLMQEPEAQARLARQKGRRVRLQWREFQLQLGPTAAGLLERLPEGEPDLRLSLTDSSPLALAQALLLGEKPALRIEGDVQLAADVNWLVDNVRWDAEEDLARLIGEDKASYPEIMADIEASRNKAARLDAQAAAKEREGKALFAAGPQWLEAGRFALKEADKLRRSAGRLEENLERPVEGFPGIPDRNVRPRRRA